MTAARTSGLVCRYAIMEPGIITCGLAIQSSSLASSQTKSALAKPEEYLKPSMEPARRPTTLNNVGPCRAGSVWLVVWHVAHCCLNSIAPSGGVAEGNGICAYAVVTRRTAPKSPGTIASHVCSVVIRATVVGCRL